ncbi:MAG: hypothetical protein EPN33_06130 [Acidobacteria bacterium]|nr:MAG: hypothetical protein EPN33_06130 [Acidobacteriota bacterium]
MPVEAPAVTASASAHESALNPRLYYALLGLAFVLAIVPLWLVRFPELMDYPAHLARCYILAHFHSNPLWPQVYRVQFGPIPDLAIDAIVTPLAHWLPIALSGKLFLTLLALLYVGGCEALGRAAWGQRHGMTLVAAFTFLNSNLMDGRVNYLFGLALAFWVLALWLRWRAEMTARRFLLFCGLSLIIYLAHLGAIAVLGVACCTIALVDFAGHRRFGRLVAAVGWMACPTLLLVFGFLGRSGRVGQLDWGTWPIKVSHLLTLTRSFNPRFEALLTLELLACAGVLLWRARWNRPLAIAGLVLLGCYVITPMTIFTANYADARFVLPGFVLLILAVRPREGALRRLALGFVLALLVARVVFIGHGWIAEQPEARAVLAMGSVLPAGARVDAIDGTEGKSGSRGFQRLAFSHLIDVWSMSRGVYMSNLFAAAGQQPLIQRPDLEICWPGEDPGCLAHFDYVWTDGPPALVTATLQAAAVPVARYSTFVLWRVRKPTVRIRTVAPAPEPAARR